MPTQECNTTELELTDKLPVTPENKDSEEPKPPSDIHEIHPIGVDIEMAGGTTFGSS